MEEDKVLLDKDRADSYLSILYPDFMSMTPKEQLEVAEVGNLIAKYVDKIREYVEKYERNRNRTEMTKQEIVRNALRSVLADEYFDILHPDFSKMGTQEKWDVSEDRKFIRENIEMIHKFYQERKREGSYLYSPNMSDKDLVKAAMHDTKIEKYFRMLYPEIPDKKLTQEEAIDIGIDKLFITNNIGLIDAEYAKRRTPTSSLWAPDKPDRVVMKEVVDELREKLKTLPRDIAGAEISRGIGVKKHELAENLIRKIVILKDAEKENQEKRASFAGAIESSDER